MDILNVPEHIRILEELLLHQDFSSSPELLESMIGDDFYEINPDGKIVERGEVVEWLLGKNPAARWQFSSFNVVNLSDTLVLATYKARQIVPEGKSAGGSVHSSLWREDSPGKTWQLIFHQSTRISD